MLKRSVEPGATGHSWHEALEKAGLKLDDMDLVEVNEAFACQVLAVLKGWE